MLARTDGDSEVLDRIGLPLFLLRSVEAELWEDVRGDKRLKVRLQHRPSGLRLDARIERIV